MSVDLATAWAAYMADHVPITASAEEVAIARRRFYSGALAAVEIAKHGRPIGDLLRELTEYGRTIGTRAEFAR